MFAGYCNIYPDCGTLRRRTLTANLLVPAATAGFSTPPSAYMRAGNEYICSMLLLIAKGASAELDLRADANGQATIHAFRARQVLMRICYRKNSAAVTRG
jgi:hypothetical protein